MEFIFSLVFRGPEISGKNLEMPVVIIRTLDIHPRISGSDRRTCMKFHCVSVCKLFNPFHQIEDYRCEIMFYILTAGVFEKRFMKPWQHPCLIRKPGCEGTYSNKILIHTDHPDILSYFLIHDITHETPLFFQVMVPTGYSFPGNPRRHYRCCKRVRMRMKDIGAGQFTMIFKYLDV